MRSRALDTVSVLGEGQWFLFDHFPVPSGRIKYTLHHGNLYLSGSIMSTCYCKVDSLISACDLVKSAIDSRNIISWRTLNTEHLSMLPVSFGRQLVALKAYMYGRTRTQAEIHAYHPFTHSWVHVGDFPTSATPEFAIVNTAGELVVLCNKTTIPIGRRKCYIVLKATLQGMASTVYILHLIQYKFPKPSGFPTT